MAAIIVVICFCAHERSPCHQLCADKSAKPIKIIRPLKQNKEEEGYSSLN